MSRPLFGCRREMCAQEVSYPADMLAEHPDGGPICDMCWDEDPARHRDEDLVAFSDLPAFVPEYAKMQTALVEALENLLVAMNEDGDARDLPDEADDSSIGWHGDGSEMKVTFGHFRRAREVLARVKGE